MAINTNYYPAQVSLKAFLLYRLTFFCQALFSSHMVELGDPSGIRTHVNGVRGRCLNHLTMGPFGAPSRTRTGDPLIKSQLLYQLS